MDIFKQHIVDQFSKEIEQLNFQEDTLLLELKYNTIVENIFEKIKKEKRKLSSVPLYQTSNNNNISIDEMSLCSGKSSDTLINSTASSKNSIGPYKKSIESTTIPNNFSLNFEMRQYAKSKYIQDVEEVFENFKLYYQSKGVVNSDWEAAWKKWVLNQNKFTKHLIKTTIDEYLELKNNYLEIAKKYLEDGDTELEFIKFKNHYIANGDLKVSWERVWENWCINYKKFKPTEQSEQAKEKQNYRWDFKKAKDTSDKIKNWLEYEKGIRWLEDHYLKNIPIPGIGWQDVMHPDFNREEILLYKIQSDNGQFLLTRKSEDILDIEVLEND
jgi:hypothetical protein